MTIRYHLTAPPPAFSQTDAVYQDVAALQSRFGGTAVHLYPFKRAGIRLPRMFYGWQHLTELRSSESSIDLHHLFANQLYAYPLFYYLHKPVVYSIVASVQAQMLRSLPKLFSFARMIVVSNQRDLLTLQKWGFKNCVHVRPGIAVDHFVTQPLYDESPFTILAGSAPWTNAQFKRKGFDALLNVAKAMPNVRLILLWRGTLFDEIQERVRYHDLTHRVEIINEEVDVNKVLASAHAAIVLADKADLVKSYPHSLIEALAAGKPVLISNTIPMADYVTENGCGQVLENLSVTVLKKGIHAMIDNYTDQQAAALRVGQRDFSLTRMLDQYNGLYTRLGYGTSVT